MNYSSNTSSNEKPTGKIEPDDILSISQENVMYRYNHNSRIYDYMSSGIADLTGYTKDEINVIGFASIVKKNILCKKEKHIINSDRGIEHLHEYYGKYLILTKSNEKRWIEDISFAILNENEELILSTGVLRNVTSSYIITEQLLDEKGRLAFILDMAEVIFIVLDKDYNFTFINKRGCQISGYNKKQILAKNLFDLVPGELRNELNETLNKIISSNASAKTTLDLPILTRKKETRYTSWQFIILKNEQDENYYVASGYDVTDKLREEKVQKVIMQILEAANSETNLEDFFKFIHNSVGELMMVRNFYIALYDKLNNMLNFPYFVDQYDEAAPAPKKFGKGLTELVITSGKSQLITKEKDRTLVKQGKTELLGSECAIWLGVPLKIKDDSIGAMVVQDYHNELTYTTKEKEILEFIAYAISRAVERKKVEEEKNFFIKELKEINKSKDKLFSLISHDLRGPFNSLLGFSEILTTEYDSLTHEEIKEYLKIIYEASKNLFGMTNNLLQFSRFQMGKTEFKPQKLILNKLVESVLAMLKGNAIKKNIVVNIEIPAGFEITADENMLNSILQNLLTNAIKFTEKGGDILIAAEKQTEESGSFNIVIVQDSGVGMSSDEISKIQSSDLFSTPGTEREYGTGLGLLLIKEFIEKHGGTLTIQSEKNVGSTFIIKIPE